MEHSILDDQDSSGLRVFKIEKVVAYKKLICKHTTGMFIIDNNSDIYNEIQ